MFSEEIIQYSKTFAPQVQKCHGTKAHAPPRPPELSKDTKDRI
jgi:hypothetical protein